MPVVYFFEGGLMRKTCLLLVLVAFCYVSSGCLGWFEGSAYTMRPELEKGDSEQIAKWTMVQTDGRKILEGLNGLSYIVVEAHGDERKADEAIRWCVITVNKLEDSPPDQVFPADSNINFTTRYLVSFALSQAAHIAYDHPASQTLLDRLRPSEEHAQWMSLWEESAANLAKWRQEARDNAAGKPLNPPTTPPALKAIPPI
jgi:hypothetical protein